MVPRATLLLFASILFTGCASDPELTDRLGAAEVRLSDQQSELTALQAELETQTQAVALLTARQDEQARELARLVGAIETANQRLTRQTIGLSSALQMERRSAAALQTLEQGHAGLERRLAAQSLRIDALRTRLLQRRVGELQSEIDRLTEHRRALESELRASPTAGLPGR